MEADALETGMGAVVSQNTKADVSSCMFFDNMLNRKIPLLPTAL